MRKVAPALGPGSQWAPQAGATVIESVPGLFQVAFPAHATAAAAFYRLEAPASPPARLNLNEVMTDNTSAFPDATGAYYDWIELENPNDIAVNLAGYGLADSPPPAQPWTLPDLLLQPRALLVVFASGLDHRS